MSESTDSQYSKDYLMHGAAVHAGRNALAVLVGSLRTTDTEVAISTLRGCCDGDWTADFDVSSTASSFVHGWAEDIGVLRVPQILSNRLGSGRTRHGEAVLSNQCFFEKMTHRESVPVV